MKRSILNFTAICLLALLVISGVSYKAFYTLGSYARPFIECLEEHR